MFKPRSIPMSQLQVVGISLSELEALRLCDLEGFDQAEAGRRMGISRGSVQRLLTRGRMHILDPILNGKALVIEEGESHEDLYSDR